MRSSGIVLGLKSWTSKLHPQLPLTNHESNRLLNALTSAFRQKLDEAHPSNTHEERRPSISSADNTPASKSINAFHSSAVHADKHLATLLTNPLLGGHILDYRTAKVELTKNPHMDPIELLEEYQGNGAASVRIAELCLDHFKKSIESLPDSKKQASIRTTQPGRRTLKWLLDSNLYDSKTCFDNHKFITDLVLLLLHEGREDDIWRWLQLDAGNTEGALSHIVGWKKTQLFKYRWRGRITHALIAAKLGPMDDLGRGPSPDQINAALDTFFKIYELKQSVPQMEPLAWWPLAPVNTVLSKLFLTRPNEIRVGVDPARFERFYDYADILFSCKEDTAMKRAALRLIHPLGRQPAEALRLWSQVVADDPSPLQAYFLKVTSTGNKGLLAFYWNFASATIHALRSQGDMEDADRLETLIVKHSPDDAQFLKARVEIFRRRDTKSGDRLQHRVAEIEDRTPMPLFTFA